MFGCRRVNRTRDSEKMLKRCIKLEPSFTMAYMELARLYGAKNDAVGPLLKKVVQLNPKEPYYHTIYGHWLSDRGNYLDALKCYTDALARSPSYSDAMKGASKIFRRFGQRSRLFNLITR